MTYIPNQALTQLPRAGSGLAGLSPDVTSGVINGADSALLANDKALDAAVTTIAAQVSALQNSNLPPGAYNVPSANAQFLYSGNANAWSAGTMGTRLSFGAPSGATQTWAFPMSVGNTAAGSVNTALLIWTEGTTTFTLKAAVVTVDQSGNQTLGNILTIQSTTTSGSGTPLFQMIGGVAISATVIKFIGTTFYLPASGTYNWQESVFNLTYDGTSTLTSGTFSLAATGNVTTNTTANNAVAANANFAAYLVGTASALFSRRSDQLGSGLYLQDRGTMTANLNNNVSDLNVHTYYSVDSIGNAAIVEAYTATSTQDTNQRLVARTSSFVSTPGDCDRTSMSNVRLPGFVVQSINTISAWSANLFDVTFTDTGGNKRQSLFSLNAGQIGVIGTYSGNNSIVFPKLWQMFSATVKFGISAGAALNQYLFSSLTYNAAASQPGVNDLTGTTNFSYTFGNVASAVQSTLNACVRLTPNMVLMVGYGGTSSTKTVIAETVTLS